MEKWKGKVAIVTGASSGIGAAIAKALVYHGVMVVGLARRHDRIMKMSDEFKSEGLTGTLHAVKADLKREEEILAAFSWVERELGGAHILVNNAGVIAVGHIGEGSTEQWQEVLQVNVLAATICMREFIKSLEKRNSQSGHIFIINSIAGQESFPSIGVYCGSKHAIRAISMSLRKELTKKKSPIKITNICPGMTDTALFDGTRVEDIMKKIPLLRSEDIANVVVDVLSASLGCEIREIVLEAAACLADMVDE